MKTPALPGTHRPRTASWSQRVQSQGALIALALLLLLGGVRYNDFLGAQNISFLLAATSKFGLMAIGMAFVIMSGGIDLSVGTVAVLASVVAARLSPEGIAPAIAGGVAVGVAAGLFNGIAIARLKLMPFVVTLCTFIAARGLALVASGRETVSISYQSGFDNLSNFYRHFRNAIGIIPKEYRNRFIKNQLD